ncbi:MAG: DNA gyrase/topoisomerase IV subunit A [Bacteroidia bacterium]|nr:DNA gyrase/topoisomerase IV subunit A [Bacteroidia bacterium]
MENNEENNIEQVDGLDQVIPVSGLYENWFLDYASYVILERAVPAMEDGLKPVQRRILHAMYEIEDGRFNKVANVIGQTMQFHPHGDAAIGDALVGIGQKELLFETQGNWGDVRTGDSAAAPRYIEVRLSKFAQEIAFNPQTTNWQLSYDGRKREPVTLPMKFPLLLAQGVEGIAVGLATKILPHNFCEILKAAIDCTKGKSFELYPDFITGGAIDVTNYNGGSKGSKVRVRAKIEEVDKKTLLIKEIPFSTTTGGLIDSILKANDSGKIKIKKVIDNTAKDVEIEIQLAPGVSPDITIDALYAFTDCEISISPNACVVYQDKPVFVDVNQLMQISVEHTRELLKKELEIKRSELQEQFLFASLEKLFIKDEMYIDFKKYSDKESLFAYLDERFKKYKKQFIREITAEDYDKLTKIPMIRITRFDSIKADELMARIQAELEQVNYDLDNLKAFQIKYYENLLKKYGKGRERKTEIKLFDTIQANQVAIANQKLYVNRAEGFVGYGLKKDEYITDCSDIDDIIVFRRDGRMMVSKVQDKAFMGKDIIHVDVFRKNDERRVYNMIYIDGKTKTSYAKRFNVLGITRDKEYDLTTGSPNTKVLYFTANPNSEAELVEIALSPMSHARKLNFDFNFAELAIKGRGVLGNIVSKYLIKSIKLKAKGASTLGGRKIWYDDVLGRLNIDSRGKLLGEFDTNDVILVITKDGNYELTNFELTNHYNAEQVLHIGKFKPKKAITLLYFNGKDKNYFVKRFYIETLTINKQFLCIPEGKDNRIVMATDYTEPIIVMERKGGKGKDSNIEETYNLAQFIEVKGWKAIGNKLVGKDFISAALVQNEIEEEEDTTIKNETVNATENLQQTLLVNEDLLQQEQEKIKRLLSDEDSLLNKTTSREKPKNTNTKDDQPKLF